MSPTEPTTAKPTPVESTPEKATPTQPFSDVVYLPCKRKRTADDAGTKTEGANIKAEWSTSCTDAEKEKITCTWTPFAKIVNILQSWSSEECEEWTIRRFQSQVSSFREGEYMTAAATDKFSVRILNKETFREVCMLSLV